jgi:hypothetical protein
LENARGVFIPVDRERLKAEAEAAVTAAGILSTPALIALLDAHNVDPISYDLKGSNAGEQYVVDHNTPRGWSVHFAERGDRTNERWFNSEAEAFAEVARRVLADPTTRRRS